MSGPEKETPASEPTKAASAPPPKEDGTSGAGAQTAQATAAVSNAVGVVRERLVAGEQLVLTGAGVIVLIVYLLFDFLLDFTIVSDFTVIVAVLTILAIWVHRWGHYDFGSGYRILIGALGVSLGLLAILSLLAWARAGGGAGDFLRLIGLIIYWISGIAAGYGAWLVFRVRDTK